MNTKFLVVGDRFNDFANHPGVITLTQALDYLNQQPETHKDTTFLLGQGLSRTEEIAVLDAAEAIGAKSTIDAIIARSRSRASKSLCHKHCSANRLLSIPRRVSSNTFEADLLVDDDNEIMSDHLTGQHLQGMLLIEAARQMFISVGEAFYARQEAPANGYFVIYDMNTSFQSFGFPVATKVRQTVQAIETPRPGRVDMDVTIAFTQLDTVVTQVDVKFGIFEREKILAKELRMAGDVVLATLAETPLKKAV